MSFEAPKVVGEFNIWQPVVSWQLLEYEAPKAQQVEIVQQPDAVKAIVANVQITAQRAMNLIRRIKRQPQEMRSSLLPRVLPSNVCLGWGVIKSPKTEVFMVYAIDQILCCSGNELRIEMDRLRSNMLAMEVSPKLVGLDISRYVFSLESLAAVLKGRCKTGTYQGGVLQTVIFKQIVLAQQENRPVNPRLPSGYASARPATRTRSRTAGNSAMPTKALFGAGPSKRHRGCPVWKSSQEVQLLVNALRPVRMKVRAWEVIPVDQIPAHAQGMRVVFPCQADASLHVWDKAGGTWISYSK